MNDYGLSQAVLYRVPSSAVSYHPRLAEAYVWWTGRIKALPCGGGDMAEFRFAAGPVAPYGATVYLRPFAVVAR